MRSCKTLDGRFAEFARARFLEQHISSRRAHGSKIGVPGFFLEEMTMDCKEGPP